MMETCDRADAGDVGAASATTSVTERSTQQPQKRRKISTACEPCRSRKSRCDGERPTCGPCRRRSNSRHSCVYQKEGAKETSTESSWSKKSLTDRIDSLERILTSLPAHQVPGSEEDLYTQVREYTLNPSLDPITEQQEQDSARSDALPLSPRRNQGGPSLRQSSQPDHATSSRDQANATHGGILLQETGKVSSAADSHNTVASSTPANEPSPVNAMGSATYVDNRVVIPSDEFFGNSSAAYFMHQVKQTITQSPKETNIINDTRHPRQPLPPTDRTLRNAYDDPFALPNPEHLALPTRELADQLLDVYWNKVYPLYPFVYKPAFIHAFENLWKARDQQTEAVEGTDYGLGSLESSSSNSLVFHCALNGVFALSCQLAGSESSFENRQSLSDIFFLRAKRLLHVDILEYGSIALVQTLLIIAQYFQSTLYPNRCWNALGLACRIAQGLGLHVEEPRAKRNALELEVRRRTWYGCCMMDTVLSMTLGRPTMTPPQPTVTLPSIPDPDEASSSDAQVDKSKSPSLLTFYVESIKLYGILGKILSSIYRPYESVVVDRRTSDLQVQQGNIEIVVSLDDQLSAFEDGIEPLVHWERGVSIRESQPEATRLTLQRQTNVLHARYLHIRILLHRPTFLRFCHKLGSLVQAPPSPSSQISFHKRRTMHSTLLVQSSLACIGAAIEIVNMLGDSVRAGLDGAWWYTIFYLHTGATVLILAQSCLPMHEYLDKEETQRSWLLCCETLHLLAQYSPSAGQALTGLRSMYQRLVPNEPQPDLNTTSATPLSRTRTVDPACPELGNAEDLEENRYHEATHVKEHNGLYNPYTASQGVESKDQASQGLPGQGTQRQSFMDFMIQDIDLLPFDQLDENWWRSDMPSASGI